MSAAWYRGARRPALLVALALLAVLAAADATAAAAAPCANEARRAEQGALELPDCRAYELVTPGALVGFDGRPARTATAGGAITYFTKHPAPGATNSGFFYLARRGADGWSYVNVGAQPAAGAQFEGICEQSVFFSPDLSRNILEAGWFEAADAARCKRPLAIVPGEPDPYRNVFLHEVAGDSYRLLNLTPAGTTPANARFQDAADDFSRIVFAEEAKLTADAPAGYVFYVWSDSVLRPLTVLPDGTPVSGELVESTSHGTLPRTGFAPVTGALSGDGSRAFFYAGGALYLRQNPDRAQSPVLGGVCTEPALACSVQVDASQGPDASGGGVFWRATPDGSTVFFTAAAKLTADSTAVTGKADLYRYDVDSSELVDLTVNAGEAADVRGVAGIAADGGTVYFAANAALAPEATPGDCPGTSEAAGHCNLYALHDGALDFLGRLSSNEREVWGETFDTATPLGKSGSWAANASPSGRYLAFVSRESLTGYDNTSPDGESRYPQIFLYDAAANAGAGQLSCVSCPPGVPLNPNQTLRSVNNYGSSGSTPSWMTNAVLDDGSVLFSTTDALLGADLNEREDVYRYRGGVLDLISPGKLPLRAQFLDASPDGTDIFFRTGQSLVGRDRDQENVNVYDARVGGGFAEPAPPAPSCEGETCRPPLAAVPAPLVPNVGRGQTKPKPKPCRRHRAKRRKGAHASAAARKHRPCKKSKGKR